MRPEESSAISDAGSIVATQSSHNAAGAVLDAVQSSGTESNPQSSTPPASADEVDESFVIDRSYQSTPIDRAEPECSPPSVRPASAPSSVLSRFSTSLPGRQADVLGGDAETEMNESVILSSMEPLFIDNPATVSLEPLSHETETSPTPQNEIIPATVLNHRSELSPATMNPDDTFEAPNEQCPIRGAALIQDADPPFMTDGRGRVVWSNATAVARSRRSRTSTATGAVSGVQARDKPRGDPQIPERCPSDSPSHRPVSLTIEVETDSEIRPCV